MKFEPRGFQPPAISHLCNIRRGALWLDMGMGKTVSTLTATAHMIDRVEVCRTLVVAPMRVAKLVWAQECAKWDHLKDLPVQLIRAHVKRNGRWVLDYDEMLRQARNDAAIHVIPVDHLVWLIKALDGKWLWDQLVLDEARMFANPDSKRFRGVKHISPALRHLKQLTGTPAPGGLGDLFGQVLLLDGGERLGRTLAQFRSRWFRQADREGRTWEPIDGATEDITWRLQDLALSLEAKDYMDLPDLMVNPVPVALSARRMEQYRKLERDMWLELENGALDSPNAAAATGKCQQFANGAVWYEDDAGRRKWQDLHDAKLEALQEVIDSAGGEPVLVAYWFKPDLYRLQRAFPHAEVLSGEQEQEDRWNRGEIPLLLAHPKSAGHGLNLQWGGRHIAFYSLTWSLEAYQQIIERIGPVRQVQAGLYRPVFAHLLIATGTVDELIFERLTTHASTQQILRTAMKKRK